MNHSSILGMSSVDLFSLAAGYLWLSRLVLLVWPLMSWDWVQQHSRRRLSQFLFVNPELKSGSGRSCPEIFWEERCFLQRMHESLSRTGAWSLPGGAAIKNIFQKSEREYAADSLSRWGEKKNWRDSPLKRFLGLVYATHVFCIKRSTSVVVQPFFYVTAAFWRPWNLLRTASRVKSPLFGCELTGRSRVHANTLMSWLTLLMCSMFLFKRPCTGWRTTSNNYWAVFADGFIKA